MATYYIKADGTRDYISLTALFAAHPVLSSSDIVHIIGSLSVAEATYDFNMATLTGDSVETSIVTMIGNAIIQNVNNSFLKFINGIFIQFNSFSCIYNEPVMMGLCDATNSGGSWTFVNNVLNNFGYFFSSDAEGYPSYITFEHNTVFADANPFAMGIIVTQSASRVIVRNNIIRQNTSTLFQFWNNSNGATDILPQIEEHFNDLYKSDLVPDNFWVLLYGNQRKDNDSTDIAADPVFLGTGNNPFSLQGTSPCIGTGHHYSNSPTVDILGKTRTNPPNIGAYEEIETSSSMSKSSVSNSSLSYSSVSVSKSSVSNSSRSSRSSFSISSNSVSKSSLSNSSRSSRSSFSISSRSSRSSLSISSHSSRSSHSSQSSESSNSSQSSESSNSSQSSASYKPVLKSYRSWITNLPKSYDPIKCEPKYLPYISRLLGYNLKDKDFNVGTSEVSKKRMQIREIMKWYTLKGTITSITYIFKALRIAEFTPKLAWVKAFDLAPPYDGIFPKDRLPRVNPRSNTIWVPLGIFSYDTGSSLDPTKFEYYISAGTYPEQYVPDSRLQVDLTGVVPEGDSALQDIANVLSRIDEVKPYHLVFDFVQNQIFGGANGEVFLFEAFPTHFHDDMINSHNQDKEALVDPGTLDEWHSRSSDYESIVIREHDALNTNNDYGPYVQLI
jgi:hypothetical protein